MKDPITKLKYFLHKKFNWHWWIYINPYDRKCIICKKRQNLYCWAWDFWNPLSGGWWEDMYDEDNKYCEE